MKYVFVALGITVMAAFLVFWNKEDALAPTQIPQVEQPFGIINGHRLELEVVRTPEEQARGLSGRESLAANAGMLFVYETPAVPGFWMKDMNFAIDIIWFDANKKIVDITANLAPETFPQTFSPRSPIQYVLEVNANWARNHSISVGDEVILYGVF